LKAPIYLKYNKKQEVDGETVGKSARLGTHLRTHAQMDGHVKNIVSPATKIQNN